MINLYSVIIVDGDATISEGLSHLVKWNDIGFNIIGTFSNGRDAMNFLKVNHADVIITDIEMPHMTGIELAEWVNENCAQTKVVFLTGCKDFDCAKKAVEYNVSHYLLKPTQLSELYETFENLKSSLDEEHNSRQNSEDIKELMRKQFFANIFSGAVRRHDDIEKMIVVLKNDFDFKKNKYAIIKLEILGYDDFLKTMTKYGTEQLYDIIHNWFALKYKHINCVPVYSFKQHITYIAYGNAGLADMVASTETIKKEIQDIFNLNLRVSTSDIYNDIFELADRSNMNPVLGFGEENNFDLVHFFEQQKTLISNIFSREEHRAVSLLDSLLKNMASFEFEVQRNYVDYIFTNAYKKMVSLNIQLGTELLSLQRTFEKNVKTTEELVEWGKEVIQKMIDSLRGNFELSENSVINKAKEYINNHYNEDITLSDVANYVFLSSAYFSRLFKKHCNENFSDYLMRVRIYKAAYLLENTSLKVYTVAEKSGFKTLKYFYKNFKETMGVSPSEYRISALNNRNNIIE